MCDIRWRLRTYRQRTTTLILPCEASELPLEAASAPSIPSKLWALPVRLAWRECARASVCGLCWAPAGANFAEAWNCLPGKPGTLSFVASRAIREAVTVLGEAADSGFLVGALGRAYWALLFIVPAREAGREGSPAELADRFAGPFALVDVDAGRRAAILQQDGGFLSRS